MCLPVDVYFHTIQYSVVYGFAYILASRPRGALYVGSTNDIAMRVHQHRLGLGSQFVKRYQIHRLVWFQQFDLVKSAILREKRLKHWLRQWKIELVEKSNPDWRDLYPDLVNLVAV